MKKCISAAVASALVMSLCSMLTFAASDQESVIESSFLRSADASARAVSETLIVNANADTGDQDVSLEEDVSVPEGDGIDLYVLDGKSGKVSAKYINSGWYGAWIQTSGPGSTAILSADGIVSDNADALIVTAEEDATSEVTINGDISAESGIALNIFAISSASASLHMNGTIQAGSGISINAKDNGKVSADVTGDIAAQYGGLYAFANNQSADEIKVSGDISSKNSAAVTADALNSSSVRYSLTGNAHAAEFGAELHARDDSVVELLQKGDLSGGSAGLFSSVPSETGKISAIVDGTIYGEHAGILFDDNAAFSAAKLDLLTWKIETGTDGYIAADRSAGGYTENKDFEKAVKYIIKTEQPAEGGSFTVTDENGNTPESESGYLFARAGSKLVLHITPDKGYLVSGADNGLKDLTPLDQDENGNYYLIVPDGGGIYLTVSLVKNDDPTGSVIPVTGDSSHMILWIGLLAAGFLAVLALVIRKLVKR